MLRAVTRLRQGIMNKRKRVAELKHRRKSKKLEEKRKALKPGK
jgi:hypothetical protein